MPEEEKIKPDDQIVPTVRSEDSTVDSPPPDLPADMASLDASQTTQSHKMEIHHPHIPHHPKPWKEYVLEGLMIFVAVTLGFFAEQLRERVVENHREKEYMQSLLNDFRIDTFTLQRTIDEKKWIIAKYDSAQRILESNNINNNTAFIYYAERYITLNDIFTSQDVSYQELRSSGNFRYMKNIALYRKIADYYNLYSRYQSADGTFGRTGKNEIVELESKLFYGPDLAKLNNDAPGNFYELAKRPTDNNFQPIKADKELLNELYIKFTDAKQRSNSHTLLMALKEKAIDIMKELKEEYHLDENP
ncbi:MAG: hypothetical protein C5B52_13875 [Bacteroidetes bacterium]|nr:MAG: hypothetical protein C5B52_13875 [Bacteroidota bacterium]